MEAKKACARRSPKLPRSQVRRLTERRVAAIHTAAKPVVAGGQEMPSCGIKTVPKRLAVKAARHAIGINPVNAPLHPLGALGISAPSDPLSMAVLTGKYWGPSPRTLTVSFMESTPSDLRARIVSHLNAWTRTGCITFAQTQGTGQVRISRGPGGYWSYLGTDVLLIPQNRPTMNLQSFTMNTAESEFKRVIRHEAGHTLGAPHEHMRKELVARIDRQKAYDYFRRTQGWSKQQVDQQVLTPLDDRSIFAHAHGPDVDHVLPVAGIDHQGWQADRRRTRHQCHRLRLHRPDLPEARTRPDDHA